MADATNETIPNIGLCVNLCEASPPDATEDELETIVASTCQVAGFPYCERVYAGSYFCENYFLGLTDGFHEAIRDLCQRHDMGATLVLPIIGQAFYDRATRRIADVLTHFGDTYDEVVVNDVAMFFDLQLWFAGQAGPGDTCIANTYAGQQPSTVPRLGLGRLFSKDLRDARYAEMLDRVSTPELSSEAESCLAIQARHANDGPAPLVEVDPTSAVVDVSNLIECVHANLGPAYPISGIDIAIHLPYCYATTGRNCGPASVDEPDSEKFRLGRGCSRHCLRMFQGCLTDEGARYIKHGRTYYYENPTCQIAGTDRWRIVYAAKWDTQPGCLTHFRKDYW